MPKASSYLLLSRHSVWYFRIVVPDAIRTLFDKRELRRSLQTKCKREALIRSRELLGQVQALFTEAFQGKRPCLDRLGISEGSYKSDSSWAQWVAWNSGVGITRTGDGDAGSFAVEIGPSLSQVMEEYESRQRLDGVSEKTISDKRAVVDLLVRIVGDLPVKHVVRKDAQSFIETALKLPPRLNQLPKKHLKQLIKGAETTISATTFNNYVKNLTTLFTFAIQEGYCDKNPFDGLRVKQREKVSNQRSRFTLEELQRLLPKESYSYGQSVKPYQYWLPLLGFYTGARLNELCQLYVDDVVQVDGVDCIHIRSDRPDQKLKNPTVQPEVRY